MGKVNSYYKGAKCIQLNFIKRILKRIRFNKNSFGYFTDSLTVENTIFDGKRHDKEC